MRGWGGGAARPRYSWGWTVAWLHSAEEPLLPSRTCRGMRRFWPSRPLGSWCCRGTSECTSSNGERAPRRPAPPAPSRCPCHPRVLEGCRGWNPAGRGARVLPALVPSPGTCWVLGGGSGAPRGGGEGVCPGFLPMAVAVSWPPALPAGATSHLQAIPDTAGLWRDCVAACSVGPGSLSRACPCPCPCRNEVTKMKFEGKTFYLYVSQKEVSAFSHLGSY